MGTLEPLGRLDHLTFKGNHKQTRYGWLRLTPAYSVHLVAELLDTQIDSRGNVLDPFSGTGTTALVCAERGVSCDTTDINPFLLWLGRTKTNSYDATELKTLRDMSSRIMKAIANTNSSPKWLPSLYQIDKWWDEQTLSALARARHKIDEIDRNAAGKVSDLLKIAFCRTMISVANVSFGHQSMSFKKPSQQPVLIDIASEEASVADNWERSIQAIASAAMSPILQPANFIDCDARNLSRKLPRDYYSCVITSPPYPNRMSYIRELRPYMYWLDYLRDGRAAGELDWQAIGGTWGCATSNVAKWQPSSEVMIPFAGFEKILKDIATTSRVLSRYVHKYFFDMVSHCQELFRVVKSGGVVNYIVGNSKFYDVMLPVEGIYAGMFAAAGFKNVNIKTIRKRTSKKELFEFLVSAEKP